MEQLFAVFKGMWWWTEDSHSITSEAKAWWQVMSTQQRDSSVQHSKVHTITNSPTYICSITSAIRTSNTHSHSYSDTNTISCSNSSSNNSQL